MRSKLIGFVVLLVVATAPAAEPLKEAVPAKDPAHIRKLVDQLGADKFTTREAAAKALLQIGPDAVPHLRAALKNDDAEVRRRATHVLDGITSTSAYLKIGLKDSDKNIRKEAAEIAERLGDKAKVLVPILVAGLKDGDEGVREAMMLALVAVDPENKALANSLSLKASVNGKYGKLLKRIHVPADKQTYTEFSEYGHYTGTSYAGHNNLPVGYWVYAYPHWYIWGEQRK